MKLCESLQDGRLPNKEETDSMAPCTSRCTCTSVQPWLISQNTKGSCTLVSPFIPTIRHKNIVELGGKIVVASQYGWLIVVDDKDRASITLFDPFSRATIDLPRLDLLAEELASDTVSFVITCVPDNNNIDNGRCVVVATCKSIIMFCRPGCDGGWGMHLARVGVEGVSRELSIGTMAICNGIIYALLINYYAEVYLVKLIFSNNNNNQDHQDEIKCRLEYIGHLKKMDWTSKAPNIVPRLVESCGELYCVFLFQGLTGYIEEVRTSKFVQKDTNADVMVVESLKNRALFVGFNSSFACFAPSPPPTTAATSGLRLLKGDCVYIASEKRVNYVYRLQDRTLAPLQNLDMSGFWVTSATKKRNGDEGCNCKVVKSSSHEEVKMETTMTPTTTTICTNEESRDDRIIMHLGELPTELIATVAMCLGLSDYSSFRSTCKIFRDSAPPLSNWPKKSTKIEYLKKQTILPWLIHFNNDDDGICNVTDPICADRQPYLMTTPRSCASYTHLDVACSKDGWLLMLGQAGHMFFYDPFNKVVTETIKPDNLIDGHIRCVGYSAIPRSSSDQSTIVVALHSSSYYDLLVCSYVYGDEAWHIFPARLHHPNQNFKPANNTPVYHNDAFYFLDMNGRLAQFKVTAGDPHRRRWRVVCNTPNLMKCTSSTSTSMATYLLKCDGALWSVFVCLLGKWVKVFRLDTTKKRWSQAYNLEKYMIFLSPCSSFATLAPSTRPDLGNKLYFSRLGGHQQDRLICYDLRSSTYCPSTPKNKALVFPEKFFESRELLGCTWIQPAWT